MLHPVLPPEPPPILESLQSANPTPVLKADTKTLGNKEKSEVQRETPLQTAGQKPTDSDLLVAKTLAAPSKPESLPPEFSPITASKSAASLGDQLSVGYPLQELKGFSPYDGGSRNAADETFPTGEKIAQTVTIENLSQKDKQRVVETTQTPTPANTSTEKSPSDQPVQIEFK
ncbi:DUF3769 domain-containing protein, partial [Scytonema sp. PRP1]